MVNEGKRVALETKIKVVICHTALCVIQLSLKLTRWYFLQFNQADCFWCERLIVYIDGQSSNITKGGKETNVEAAKTLIQ